MASVAVRLAAESGQLVQEFGKTEQRAEQFKSRLERIGAVAGNAFAPIGTGLKAVAAGTSNVLSSLGRLSSVASSSAAILSKFTQGNEELKKRFESLTVTLAIMAPALSALGPAIAFLATPIGIVIAAIAGAILVFRNWEAVSRAVTETAARVWAKLGEFFTNLWGGLGQAASGLGQILLGALTLDVAKIKEGYQQMAEGLVAVGGTMASAASGIASGIGVITTRLQGMITGIGAAKKAAQEFAVTTEVITEQVFNEAARRQREAMEERLRLQQEENERFLTMQQLRQQAELESLTALELLKAEQQQAGLEQAGANATAALGIAANLLGFQRVFAAGSALVSTFQGAAQALTLPFPANLAAAALVLAKGLGFVAAIKSVKGLAEGGIVTGPTLAMIGEAGPEAVVPLDRAGRFGAGRTEQTIMVLLDGREIAKAMATEMPQVIRVRAGLRTV